MRAAIAFACMANCMVAIAAFVADNVLVAVVSGFVVGPLLMVAEWAARP